LIRREIVELACAVLERELDVIQPRVFEALCTRFVQAHTGGDEVGVVAQRVRFLHQFLQVVTHQRLTA